MTSAQTILRLLGSQHYRLGVEARIQSQIEFILNEGGVNFQREFVLDKRNRIDFFLEGGLGIEVKITQAATPLLQQCSRYLKTDQILELIVVSIQPIALLPKLLHGKPIYSLPIWNLQEL